MHRFREFRQRRAEKRGAKAEEAESRKIAASISNGSYDVTMARTFTPEDERKLKKAIRIAVNKAYNNSSITYDQLAEREDDSLRARYNKFIKNISTFGTPYTSPTIKSEILNILAKKLIDGSATPFFASYLLGRLKIDASDPELQNRILDVIKENLISGNPEKAKKILHYIPIDKDLVGKTVLEVQDSLLSQKKEFYDPVRVAEQLGVPKEVIEQLGSEYYNQLVQNGNKPAAVAIGTEVHISMAEIEPMALDVYSGLIRRSPKEAEKYAAERGQQWEDLRVAARRLTEDTS